MTDAEFIASLELATTPEQILRIILENETFLGYDPYYRELREAMMNQAAKVLEQLP